MTQEDREIAIEHTMDIVADLVPYGTPNYWEEVRKMAEGWVDAENKIPSTNDLAFLEPPFNK